MAPIFAGGPGWFAWAAWVALCPAWETAVWVGSVGSYVGMGMFLLDFTRRGQAANNKKVADSRRNVGFRLELLITGEKILRSGDMRSRVVKIQMCCHRKPHPGGL